MFAMLIWQPVDVCIYDRVSEVTNCGEGIANRSVLPHSSSPERTAKGYGKEIDTGRESKTV